MFVEKPNERPYVKGCCAMPEIIKTYTQTVPAMRFIGKKYGDEDRVNGGFGKLWSEWLSNGWFEVLQTTCGSENVYEDGDATIGLMRWKEGEPFEYWIGVFCPRDSVVPEGHAHVDFPESEFSVTWLYGKEEELFGQEQKCAERLEKKGYRVIPDELGAYWFFERYVCPRFTTPDEHGNVVLDICHFIDKN